MKKLFLAVIALTAMTTATFAQTDIYGRTVRFGFKVDPVFVNNLSPKDNDPVKDGTKFGVNYGLMADVMFSDGRGAFATGLEVVHTGGKLKYTSNDKGLYGAGKYDLKLQYLQLPLSVKLRTNEMSGFRFWGQFGTYVGAMIGSRVDFTPGSGNTATAVDNEKILKYTNRMNVGLLAGLGGEYHIADKTDLMFGLGLENGFTDITPNNKGLIANKGWNDGKVGLNRWAIRLGVFF